MSNDNVNADKEYTRMNENVQRQQFTPGRFPTSPPFGRPGMGEPPRTAPPETGGPRQSPGMEPPRSGPPSFTPEAPRMDRRPGGQGPGQDGPDFEFFGGFGRPDGRGQIDFGRGRQRVRPRELRGCLNRFTFFWLINGNSFWFYPTFVDNQFVLGFRWRRNRWEFERINIRRIFFFRCF